MARRRIENELIFSPLTASYERLARFWILKILGLTGAKLGFVRGDGYLREDLAAYLGLEPVKTGQPFDVRKARQALADLIHPTRGSQMDPPKDGPLARNLAWLSDIVGLDRVERRILLFRVVAECHPGLEVALDLCGNLTKAGTHRILSKVLGHRLDLVRDALGAEGRLNISGLLRSAESRPDRFHDKLDLPGFLADHLLLPHRDPSRIFAARFHRGPGVKLKSSDFPQLAQDRIALEGYLKEGMREGAAGINLLIHGSPGTGKTEFARMLVARIGGRSFEIACRDEDGEPIEGVDRLRTFQLAQAILAGDRRNLVLFDEVEDVFRAPEKGASWRGGNASGMKGHFNQVLEGNPIPTIWITNSVDCIDPAFLRRFDYILEIGIPPRSVRQRILERYLGPLQASSECVGRWVEHPGVSPAVVERAAKVIGLARKSNPSLDQDEAFSRALGNTLEALGEPREALGLARVVTPYRPEILQTDFDLEALRLGITRAGQGRLCFYGPPGTGKSAFARHLAVTLDRPLLVRRASDLLSCWVGRTEYLMSRMFREATQEGGVLLLDEADSFLRDRQEAKASWEVTQVNEMLTQMESFNGIFIASTNLMESLDPATLRRFDAKIHFGYLKGDQVWTMFLQTAEQTVGTIDWSLEAEVKKLGAVTPGDFATLIRQAQINPLKDPRDLLDRLRREMEAKPGARRAVIGF